MTVDPRTAQSVRQADEQPDQGRDPLRTLLWTAASIRPLGEVAALVGLLRRTGAVADPADEALRAAAVCRPVDEVRRMVALLNEPSVRGVAEAPALPRDVTGSFSDAAGGRCRPRGTPMLRRPPASAGGAPGGRATRRGAWTGQAVFPVAEIRAPRPGLQAPSASGAPAGAGTPNPGLRWPAAAVLLLMGLVHLPRHLVPSGPGGHAGPLALAVTSLCLALAVRVLARDTVLVWALSAVVALGVVAMHALVGTGALAPVPGSLVGTFVWARLLAPVCAVVLAALAGAALLPYRAQGVRAQH